MSKNKSKPKDFGPTSGDHAGDDQGLPNIPEADSESVKELVDEGQPSKRSPPIGLRRLPSRRHPKSGPDKFLRITSLPSISNRTKDGRYIPSVERIQPDMQHAAKNDEETARSRMRYTDSFFGAVCPPGSLPGPPGAKR
jgi:hypothetical protein